MHRARKGLFVLFTAAMVAGSLAYSAGLAFADDCPAGARPATAADIPLMTQAGIPNAVVGMCWNASDPNVGQTDAQAKQQLNSMWCGGKAAQCGPYTSTIDGLDPKFATCAAKFLQAVRQRDSSICIASAFRSTQHQAYLCGGGCGTVAGPCAAAGKSMHQQGLAIDIQKPGMNTLPAFVHQMAQQGGGVSFPVRNDDGHMQPAGGDCSTPGYVAPSGPPVQARTPLQNAVQGLQSFLAPPQPQQCPPGYMLMNGSCLPPQAAQTAQTSNPYSYLSPPPPPPSITPSTGGTTGTTGTTGSTNTNTNSNGSNPINLNDSGGTSIAGLIGGNGGTGVSGGQNGSSTSAIDLINQIANPTTTDDGSPTAQTPTGTPVALTSSLNNEVMLHGTPVAINSSWQSSSTYSLSPAASQTFVSQDLSQTPTSLQPMQPVNSTFAILENIKQTLLQVLVYLKPFGGTLPRAPATTTANNSTTAFME